MPDIQQGKYVALNDEVSKALLADYASIHRMVEMTHGRLPATKEALIRFFVVYMSNQIGVNLTTMQGFYHTAAWLFSTTPDDVRTVINDMMACMGNLNKMLTDAALNQAIEFFLREQDAQEYRDILSMYAGWCKSSNIRWSRVAEPNAIKYLQHLYFGCLGKRQKTRAAGRDRSVEKVDKHREALNQFMEWCVQHGIVVDNPFRHIPRLRSEDDIIALGAGHHAIR